MKFVGIELPEPVVDAARSCRQHWLAAGLFSLLVNLLYLAPAIYMLQVYDRVLATGGRSTLLFITLALAVALITLAALDSVRTRLLARASARLDARLSPLILKRMLTLGGPANVQAMRDMDTMRQALSSPAAAALLDLPWAPIFILVCFLLHFWIGLLAIFSIALLVVIARRNQKVTQAVTARSSAELAAAHAAEQSAAVYAGTLRGLGMVETMVGRQLARRSSGVGGMAEAQFAGSRFTAISKFIRLFVQSLALGVGALLAIAGEISAGGIIAGSILLGRALQPIDALIGGWSTLMAARAALARLADVLGQPFEADRERTALPRPVGKLDVEQVGVRSPDGRPILYNVTFTANPGEILGIVGPSGSGKTTLAKVVAGAVIPDLGTVRIDGAQRSDWDGDTLGRHIGYLPQEPSLFEGTIKENIARFDTAADGDNERFDAHVVAAAKLAGVHELILKFPKGYDTPLGPLGAGVSAGQAQRIAFARALYGSPTLLILDEPNAFLDAEGEASLIRAIQIAKKNGATVLLIAHRKSVLEGADRLLVLEGGVPKMLGPAKDVVVRLAPPGTESAA